MASADLIPGEGHYPAAEFAGYLGTAAAQMKRMERLAAHGCAEPSAAWLRAGPVGRARGLIERLEGPRFVWQPEESGELLVVLPVRGQPWSTGCEMPVSEFARAASTPIAEIVAWAARRPELMATRHDGAAWINEEAVDAARWGEPLTVFRTAWSWLIAGAPAHGAVMLDPDVALGDLRLLRRVEAEDAAHGAELAEAMQRRALKGLPTVSWSEGCNRKSKGMAA